MKTELVRVVTNCYAVVGVLVGGVPAGGEAFVQSHIECKVEAAMKLVQRTVDQPRGFHLQSLWTQLLSCCRPILYFLAQTCYGPAVAQGLH